MRSFPYNAGFAFLLLALSIGIVYSQGVSGPFVFDDFINIVDNKALHVETLSFPVLLDASQSLMHSDVGRPLAMMTFAFNYSLSGLDPAGYKQFNIAIHVLNACLLFLTLRALFSSVVCGYDAKRSFYLALLCALAWGLHPVNLTSVLYVVQRMTSLAALFMLLGLWGYVVGRSRILAGKAGAVFCWLSVLVGTGLGILCKENAVLLPVLIFVLEVTIFRGQGGRRSDLLLIRLGTGMIGCVLVFALIGFFLNWHPLSYDRLVLNYVHRPFTLEERGMTQLRVLWFYSQQILLPDIRAIRLHNDDMAISTSLTQPVTTLLALLAWLGVLACGVYLWFKKQPLLLVGVAWFLGGHLLESSVIALEMVHVHRNYVPMIGPLVAVLVAAQKLPISIQRVFYAVFIVMLGLGTAAKASSWGEWGTLVLSEAQRGPTSSRAQFAAGRWYYWQVENAVRQDVDYQRADFEAAQDYFERSYEVDTFNSNGLYALIQLYDLVDQPVPERYVAELERRLSSVIITNEHTNKFMELIVCNSEARCSVQLAIFNRLINAVFVNPKASGYQQAALANVLSGYLLSLELIEPGLFYAHQAVERFPGLPLYWKNYAIVAGVAKRPELQEEAKKRYAELFGEPLVLDAAESH